MLSEHCHQVTDTAEATYTHHNAAPRASTQVRGARVILVAEEPETLSHEVLRRADALRSAMGFELRFLPARPASEREAPLQSVLRHAALPDVALVLLSIPPQRSAGGRDGRWHDFLRRCQRPFMLVGPRSPESVIVAASDCSDPALPVVREAEILAMALRGKLTLVHNVNPVASRFAERIGFPVSARLADLLAMRLRAKLALAAVESEVVITRDDPNSRAVLEVALTRRADVLVAGVKSADVAQHRTADAILDAASQSVLFIPLPSHNKFQWMD